MDDENLPSHPKKQKTAEAEDSVVPNQAQSRVGKPRPLNREYASPMHRRMLLKRAFDDVITYGISVRLAAETHGVAKSSLADFIRRQNIRLPNNRRHSSAAAAAASASLTCTADPNYAAPSPASLPSPGCSTASDNQQQIQSADSGLSAPVSSGAGVNSALVGGGTGHCRQWLQNGLPTLVPWYSSSASWNVKDSSRRNSHRLPSADAASVTTKVENEISDHSQLIASASELLVGSVVKEEPQVVDTMSLLSDYSDGAQMSTSSAPSVAAAAAAAWKTADLSQQLCEFVNRSPSPFHAVAESRRMLEAAGFAQLREDQSWSLRPNQKGFVTRNGSTIFAFATGGKWKPGNGFSIVGAHTDSPCLRLKPVSLRESAGELLQCGVETYGGGLWYSWFDRDLTVAGRVIVRSGSGGSSDSSRLTERLVNLEAPVFKVPSLAIHLNRTVNDEGFAPNKENHLAPILCRKLAAEASGAGTGSDTSAPPQRHPVGLLARVAEKLGCQPADILDWDLYLADTQPAAVTGLNGDFVSSPRLDNLLSCYSALTALIEAPGLESDPNCRVVCLYDHEEIGSESAQGAGSALTLHFLRRLSQGGEFETAVPKSLLVSADVAHAVHPNYEEKHERKHRPSLFGGVVIKENANQRYATNCLTSSLLRECLRLSDPAAQLQDFVIRQDMACGSTIGPILAAKVGLPTIDVGSPIFGMHSIRETGAAAAPGQGVQLFSAFFKHFPALREAMETQ